MLIKHKFFIGKHRQCEFLNNSEAGWIAPFLFSIYVTNNPIEPISLNYVSFSFFDIMIDNWLIIDNMIIVRVELSV